MKIAECTTPWFHNRNRKRNGNSNGNGRSERAHANNDTSRRLNRGTNNIPVRNPPM
jgi:hypothetical protein